MCIIFWIVYITAIPVIMQGTIFSWYIVWKTGVCILNKMYTVTDRNGKKTKTGLFSEPEVRMAAKAGMRVFEINDDGKYSMEITQELTGLFNDTEHNNT